LWLLRYDVIRWAFGSLGLVLPWALQGSFGSRMEEEEEKAEKEKS
jgi:hypothetical protein